MAYSYDNLGRTAAKTLTVGGRTYETGYSYLPGTTATFDYNTDGLRIRKTVNGIETNYTLHGKNIIHITQGANDLHSWYAQCFSLREALVSGGDFELLALSLALLGATITPSASLCGKHCFRAAILNRSPSTSLCSALLLRPEPPCHRAVQW